MRLNKIIHPPIGSLSVKLIIRTARQSDASSIGQLAGQFANYLRELGDTTDFQLTAQAFLRDGFGETPAFAGLVAEEDGEVIGYLLYHFGYDSDQAARTLHIADLYVADAKRNKGVGRSLMTRVASIARDAGAEELIWSVYNSNAIASRFYQKIGAQPITGVFFMKLKADSI